MPPTAVAFGLTLWQLEYSPRAQKIARAAVDVERHHHPVTALEVLHRRTDLLHHADELVPERHADPGVGHHPVVEVQVRSADRGHRHPDDGVVGVPAWI